MNMELLETNRKYVLPLDTVDLSLLSTLNVAPKHHSNLLPLWSKNNLTLRNEDCYFEFEIKDKEDISEMETYYDKIKFGIDDKQDISESKATYLDNTKSHCILCNELVESADFHALCNKRHEASLKSAILLSEEENESQIKIETRSDDNKTNITPFESNEEKEPKDCATKTTDINIKNAQSELEKNESVVRSKASKTDTSKVKNFFCSVCYVSLHKKDIRSHIRTHKAAECMLEYCIEADYLDIDIDIDFERKLSTKLTGNDIKQRFCVVCQENVPNNTHCISKHFSGNLHKHNVANYQTCTKHVKSTRGNLESVSKIEEENASINPPSEIFLKDTSSESVAINIPVAKGNGEIDTKKDTNSNPITQTASEQDIKNSISVTSETAEDVLEITLNPNELRCSICLVIIPNKTQNIQDHFNGYNHNNSARILVQNRLKLIGNQYFCDGCREHVTVGDQFDHINKRSHAVNMIRTLTNDIVNALAENKDKRDTKSYKDTIIKRQDQVCQVCNVKVPKIKYQLKMHIEGRKHVRNLREILSNNKILEKDDCFNCSVCQTVLTKDALFNHLKDQNHLTALRTKLPNSILTTLFRNTEEI
ncbi:unnamed protein product [Parnassius apollo]|uniref:(apollo) hypothetical protein n=1 Tax=Parnassius apollo TaxID=110799 RepID=A0A8S3X414_PARAO|nr:unnamed protein product [Parnassius apollo]